MDLGVCHALKGAWCRELLHQDPKGDQFCMGQRAEGRELMFMHLAEEEVCSKRRRGIVNGARRGCCMHWPTEDGVRSARFAGRATA